MIDLSLTGDITFRWRCAQIVAVEEELLIATGRTGLRLTLAVGLLFGFGLRFALPLFKGVAARFRAALSHGREFGIARRVR